MPATGNRSCGTIWLVYASDKLSVNLAYQCRFDMLESPTSMALGIFGAELFLNIIDITVIPLVESLSIHSPHGALNNGAYFWN